MKLATWNVNSLAVRLPQVLDWLQAHPVDALVLQETKLTDDKFPRAEIEARGLPGAAWFGQKTYNGVALLSRSDADRRGAATSPGFDDDQARVIAGTVGRRARDRRLLPQRPGAGQRQVRTTRCAGWTRCATGCAPNWRATRNWC